jgi:FG-GAP-like repeat/FG-GAP repeat
MNRSLRLFRTGVSLVALAAVGCGSSTPSEVDGGKTDGAAGSKTDGSAGAGGAAGKGGGSGGAAGGAGGAAAGTSGSGGAKADGGGLDLGGIAPPTMLTATVLDRRATTFELVWTAPSDSGAAVSGYQVRYAKVPITTTNFDDTTVTTSVPYIGKPAAPGSTDGLTVRAYIENSYYFAVTGTDSAGTHVGTFMVTSAAVAAHFNTTIIASPTTTADVFGATSDGSGDLNGDGISDIVVGTSNASRAYLFLGSATFAGGSPSVTFSSATDTGFGTAIAQIGDIDGDGRQDLAISDLSISAIYIYKGRANWPLTLTDLQADYVISTSGSWTSASAGTSFARLGDFDGDGIDDFAIGGPTYSAPATRVGRVAIVYGSKTFTNFTLPSTTRTLEIGGDPALSRTQFGQRLVGLGHFYSVTTGTTLIVSAPGLGDATNTSDNQGRLYAFHGRAAGAPIDATMADNVLVGPGKGAVIGQVLSNLGPIENTFPSVGSGNSADVLTVPTASGTGFVLSGTPATGPFASSTVLYQSSGSEVGQMLFGGGTSGRDTSYSLIGSSNPDVAIVGGNTAIAILDGALLSGLTSPVDALKSSMVQVPLPTGWSFTAAASGGLIPDINHDGYPDFVLGDTSGSNPGRIVVFW